MYYTISISVSFKKVIYKRHIVFIVIILKYEVYYVHFMAVTKKFETKLTRSNTDKLSLFETTTPINDSPLVTAFKSFFFF